MKIKFLFSIFLFGFFLFSLSSVFADEYTSTSFRVVDPVVRPSGFATSTSFQLWSSLGEVGLGTSSITSFQLGAGFLLFPFASTPSVSTTAGDGQVACDYGIFP